MQVASKESFFVPKQQIRESLQCTICGNVLVTPCGLRACGHRFCLACLIQHYAECGGRCFVCSKSYTLADATALTEIEAQIDELQVYCKRKKNGCTWQGPCRDLTEHMRTSCLAQTPSYFDFDPVALRTQSTSTTSSQPPQAYCTTLSTFPLASQSAASLTMDTLALIFSYVRLRPRLLVLRYVCKLWNNAIVIGIRNQPDDYLTLRILPPRTVVLPPHSLGNLITELGPRMRTVHFAPRPQLLSAQEMSACTSLTALHLADVAQYRDTLAYAPLLAANSALTHLSLPGYYQLTGVTTPPISIPDLPLVRSLRIGHQELDSFRTLRPLFSLLTRLKWNVSTWLDFPACPSLQSLSVTVHMRTPPTVFKWISSLPSLTSLSLTLVESYSDEVYEFLSSSSCVVKLRATGCFWDFARLAKALAPHTRLRALALGARWGSLGVEELLPMVGSRLTALEVPLDCPELPSSLIANLESLEIYHFGMSLLQRYQWPRLRKLIVRTDNNEDLQECEPANIADALQFVHYLVHNVPSLSKIFVDTSQPHMNAEATTKLLNALELYDQALRKAESSPRSYDIFIQSYSTAIQYVRAIAKPHVWVCCTGKPHFSWRD